MTTREKIIVGVMLLTVGYGAIELLLPRAKTAKLPLTAKSSDGLNAFITKVAAAVKGETSDAGDLIIQRAENAWKQDPFLEIRKPEAQAAMRPVKEPVRPPPNMVYSGFIEVGSKRLAIINGMEYEPGERLDPGGFTIQSVLPNKVIMSSSKAESTPIVLPLQENE
jgi:hypothetical protein